MNNNRYRNRRDFIDKIKLLDKEDIIDKSHTLRYLTIPGIYFLIKSNEIVYIGESNNLIRRIFKHKSSMIFDSFTFQRTPNLTKKERTQLERKYINEFKPLYNVRGK